MRFISSIKKIENKEISFIILPCYKKIKNDHYGLSKIDNKISLIEKSINSIKGYFNLSDILYISNVKNSKLNKIRSNFRILENNNYENFSDFENLRLALQNINHTNIVILPETVLFSPEQINVSKSTGFYCKDNLNLPGFISIRNIVTNISYGNAPSSPGIYFITAKDSSILKSVLYKKETNNKILLFEVLNLAILSGLKLDLKEIKCQIPEF